MISKITKIWACSLGILLLWGLPSCTPNVFSSPQEQTNLSKAEILAQLKQGKIIYLGETHNSLADHQAQLEIIAQLYQQNPRIAIGMEMFQRPYQQFLDQYLAGEINETQLREKSEYEQRWGFDWELYAPILRFAKAHNLPILALNTPSEVSRQVAMEGLGSLSEQQKQYIPPVGEINTDNQNYRQMVKAVFDQHMQAGHGNSDGFERFFTTQVLWDETMADKVAQFYQDNPDYQVVVLAGKGHIIYGYGIPSRVKRRLGDSIPSYSVWLGEFNSEEFTGIGQPADYFWQH